MKKIIGATVLGLALSAQAQSATYEVYQFSGVKVDGCELVMARGYGESHYSFHISNISDYWVESDNSGLKIIFRIHNGSGGYIKQSIRIEKDKLEETLKTFRYVRNRCSFAPMK